MDRLADRRRNIKRNQERQKICQNMIICSDAAYLRAKEDYLMGINFSRVLTLKYGRNISNYLKTDRTVVSVGRVMTCVLGMIVRREREIRAFVKTPFFRVITKAQIAESSFEAEWRVTEREQILSDTVFI